MRESARTLCDQHSLPAARPRPGVEQLVGAPKHFIRRRMSEMVVDQPVVYADHLIGIVKLETDLMRTLESRPDFLATGALAVD